MKKGGMIGKGGKNKGKRISSKPPYVFTFWGVAIAQVGEEGEANMRL